MKLALLTKEKASWFSASTSIAAEPDISSSEQSIQTEDEVKEAEGRGRKDTVHWKDNTLARYLGLKLHFVRPGLESKLGRGCEEARF